MSDWMDKVPVDNTLMEQIKASTKKLTELSWKVQCAQEALDKATKDYQDYAQHTLPDLFRMNGIESIKTEDGSTVSVVTKTTCSINKNAADKVNVAEWLRKYNGEQLIKSELTVPVSQKAALESMGVTFEESMTMNTNSVKAFVLGLLGQKETPALITKEDLPKGLNFYQYDDMEIKHEL